MTDNSQTNNAPVDRTEEDRDFAAITDAEIWQEAKDRLQIAHDAYSENRTKAEEAMRFREGDQWDMDVSTSVSQDEPELTINLTDAFVNRVVNNIKQQRPRGKCHPVGDGADIELAEIINGIGRHVETRSEASVAYDLAADCAVTAGEGYFRLIAEYEGPRSFRKDLRILPIENIFSVSMDPGAIMPSGADQTWCIISSMMNRQEYKRRYPSAKNVNWSDVDRRSDQDDWESKEEVRLAEYFRIREKSETLYMLRNGQGQEATLYRSELPKGESGRISIDDARARLLKLGWLIVDDRESCKRQVEWFRLNGLVVVERQEIPGTWIPVFRVSGNRRNINGKVRKRGMVEFMMDPQRMVNYGEVAKIKRLGLAPKAPWVAAEGQLDGHEDEWAAANQKSIAVLVYKPIVIETGAVPLMIPPPQRQEPAQIEQGFSEFVQGMRTNLTAVAGMPNEPGQDQQGVVVSGKAIDRRQFLSDQSHFQYYDNLTLGIAQCWRVIAEWIPAYYSEPGREQRIIGEDSTPQMVTLNAQSDDPAEQRLKNDMSVGKYDVVMDTGPGYETKREEGAQNLIEMIKIPPLAEIIAKTAPDLVFRSIDHPYMQELADRLMASNPEGLKKIMEGLSSRAKNIVQSLANENQALQQKLQAAEVEIKQGLQKAHMAAAVKAHDTEVRADTSIKVAQIKEHGATVNEEIRAGGKIIDATAGRGHDAQMLEKQLLHDASQAAATRSDTNINAAADRAAAAQQPTGE